MSRQKDTRTKILKAAWALLEANPGKNLSMGEIAKASGISRQAVYLHFSSRTELLIATSHYVDEVNDLEQRLKVVQECQSAVTMLEAFISTWGSYIPEIYGVSKALMISKENDEATALAWKKIMGCLQNLCKDIIQKLITENRLSPHWGKQSASDFLYGLVSISNWEQFTLECRWSNEEYVSHLRHTALKALLSTEGLSL